MKSSLLSKLIFIRSTKEFVIFYIYRGAFDNEQFERSLEVYKAQQNSLIDELATMISCLKEKEVEDQIEVRLKQLKSAPDDEDESTIARKFEGKHCFGCYLFTAKTINTWNYL